MAKDWFQIRTKTEPAKMKYMSAKINGFPDEAAEKYYFQKLQQITAAGADIMRNYIEYDRANFTETGKKRAARGGNGPGRKDSGDMIKGIVWSGKKDGKGKYRFAFGWLNGTPGYSIFQEYGVEGGVKGMNSLQYAREFVRKEIRYLASNGKGTRFGPLPTEFKD